MGIGDAHHLTLSPLPDENRLITVDPKLRQFRIVAPSLLAVWIGWCFLTVFEVAPAVASQQANNHIFSIALTLCFIPLVFGATGLIVWLKH